MNINPINQEKIIGYDNLFKNFINLLNKKRLPNKILLSGSKGVGKSTFAYHFINYILSINEENSYDINKFEIKSENKSFKLVKKLTHPNFHLIDLLDEKKNIEISQIRRAITYSQKSAFNNNFRIILIDNLESLNINSVNSLLKILEEPNEKLLFILVHDSSKRILDTIKSRCIIFKKQFTFAENVSISSDLINLDIKKLFNKNIINHYFTIGDFVFLYNFSKKNELDLHEMSIKSLLLYLLNYNVYKNELNLINLIYKLIQSYFYYSFLENKNSDLYNFYRYFIKKINYTIKFNLDLETLFFEFKVRLIND